MTRVRTSTWAMLLSGLSFMLLWELREPLYEIGQAAVRQHAALSAACTADG